MKRTCLIAFLLLVLFAAMGFSAYAEESGSCYTEDGNGQKTYYSTLDEAIAAGKDKEIFVISDTTVAKTELSGGTYTVTGIGNPTVKQSGRINVANDARLILNNITFDLQDLNANYYRLSNGIMTLNSAKILNGSGDWGTIVIGDFGSAGILTVSGESEISGKSTYQAANHGSVITVHSNCTSGTVNMTGGKIINKDSLEGHCPIYAMTAKAKINISGNTVIDKAAGANNAIGFADPDVLVLDGDFSGDISVNYGSLGDSFGTVKNGAKITTGTIKHAAKGSKATVENGRLYWYYEAYLGTDEAENRCEKIADAVKKSGSGTVGLARDASWVGYNYGNDAAYGMHHKTLIIEGNGHTLSLADQFYVGLDSVFTMENITVDLKSNRILIGCNGSLTLGSGAVLKNAVSSTPVSIEKRMNQDGGTFKMLAGSLITNCKTADSAIVRAWSNGKVYIAGEISNNSSGYGAVLLDGAGARMTLSGSAYVRGNNDISGKKAYNIVLANKDQLTVESGFDGEAGISYGNEGSAFAAAGEGLVSLPGVSTIVSDSDEKLFGFIKDGSIVWQKTPELDVQLDYGTYDGGKKAIIRFLISFPDAPDEAHITSYGAYIISGDDFDEAQMRAAQSKFIKENQQVIARGKGYIVDIHTENLDLSYPVAAFCFIENIDEPVYMIKTADAVSGAADVKELSRETVDGYESSYEN